MEFKATKNFELGQGQWTVSIKGQEWKDFLVKAENSFKSKLTIPGFRKGKVPDAMLKKYLTEEKLLNEAHHFVLRKAYDFALQQKSEIQPYNTPEVEVEKLTTSEHIMNINFDIKPEINIRKFTGFKELIKEPVKVTKKHLDDAINNYRQKFAIYSDKKTPISKGDLVKFDFVGYVDGKTFIGGDAVDFTLEIGSNNFIPGFEDQMIGLKIGDSSIKVKFPDDYHVETLKSKPAEFKLKIKEIKTKTLPAIDEELVKDVNLPNIKTLAQFKEFLNKNIEEQLFRSEKDRFIGTLFQKITSDSKIIIPQSIVKKEAEKLEIQFDQQLKAKQIDKKSYMKQSGLSEADIKAELQADARIRIVNGSIVEFVKQKEKIEPTKAEINSEWQKLSKQFNIDIEQLKNGIISEEQITSQLINDKVFDFLYMNNGSVAKVQSEPVKKPTTPNKPTAVKKASTSVKKPTSGIKKTVSKKPTTTIKK